MTPDRHSIEAANRIGQQALRRMLDAGVQGDPEHPLTKAYVAAERLLDELLVDAQWETAKAAMDELIDADRGNHYVFPAGVGR